MPTTLTATKIYVTICPLNQEYENPRWDTVPVYRFSNGAVMVLDESVPDWFFNSMDDFEPNGLDVVESWVVSDETEDFTKDALKAWVQKAIECYNNDAGTAKILELL